MAKNSILDYDTTPDNNTDMGGIGIQGTSAVNNFDNAFRTIMSQIADFTGGSTIASGTTTDLSTVKGQYVSVSGTSTITSFGTAKAGWMKYLRFTGAATITYNATSMILPGGASISTQPGDYALFVSEGSGNWRCLDYSRAATLVRPAQRGQLSGLSMANNSVDPTNDIDIGVGDCASDDTIPVLMTLATTLTKRLDAGWAVGSGNGGLDAGVAANGTYHIWLIQRSDTGLVDALFSNSPSAPTMPANYDRKRRIGAIIRTAGAIRGFYQSGDRFELSPLSVDVTAVNPGTTSVLRTLSVPSGIVVTANVTLQAENSGTGVFFAAGLFCPQVTPLPSMLQIKNIRNASGSIFDGIVPVSVVTNNLSQIYSFCAASDASCTLTIRTLGWIDTRGQ